MNCNTTHYRANSSSVPGDPTLDEILDAFAIAIEDPALPARHVLISGGTPSPRDYHYFDDVCAAVARRSSMPVDVMMPPRPDDAAFIDRLVDSGISGFAINLEVFDRETAKRVDPQKARIGLERFATTISRAVERTGGNGRVRSLLLVGLEPAEQTLEGVRFLAELGCDPVLSPFRPTPGTGLADHPVPAADFLAAVYLDAAAITRDAGVRLGPRCIPCQHNTLTFPDATGGYYFS